MYSQRNEGAAWVMVKVWSNVISKMSIFRKEKEFLIANRKRLEKEFAIQREKQLSEALDREAEIARIIRQQQNEIFKIKRKEHQV